MSADAIQAFADRLSNDESFRDQLASAPTPEERLRLANEAGYAITGEDMGAVRSAVGVEELSDEDLERVAGGMDDQTIGSLVVTTVSVAVAAASWI